MWKSGQILAQIFFISAIVSFSIAIACSMDEDKARYDHYRLMRFSLQTAEQVELFQELEEKSDSYTFYGHALQAPQEVTVLVAAHK